MKKIIILIVAILVIIFGVIYFRGGFSNMPSEKLPEGSLVPAEAEALKNIEWFWEKTILGEGTEVIPKMTGAFSIELDNQGTVLGRTDCNGFSGGYEFGSDGAFKTGPYAMTIKFCEGTQENLFVDTLAQTTGYAVDADGNLVLLLAKDAGAMIFKRK